MGNLGNKGSSAALTEIYKGGELFPKFPKSGPVGLLFGKKVSCRLAVAPSRFRRLELFIQRFVSIAND